jgi:hypothetical protein
MQTLWDGHELIVDQKLALDEAQGEVSGVGRPPRRTRVSGVRKSHPRSPRRRRPIAGDPEAAKTLRWQGWSTLDMIQSWIIFLL